MTDHKESNSWGQIQKLFEEKVPFHKWLDFEITGLETGSPKLVIYKRDEFVGNFVRGNLHGGIISTVLDIIGGIVAFTDVATRKKLYTEAEQIEQFARTGTIDLRIDYLRPGFGNTFIATAYVLRTGNKVAVTRMELNNDEKTLIAVGTGAYVIG